MNFWHVAYINRHANGHVMNLCGLRTQGDPQELISHRTYRCLIKWAPPAADARGLVYECLDVRFEALPNERWMVKLADPSLVTTYDGYFRNVNGYSASVHDIGPLLDFALSGKVIVENGIEISLANAIDRFEDVRHVFNLPPVKARGHFDGHDVQEVNLGEYQLFNNVNERRAALSCPVVINLKIGGFVTSGWEPIQDALRRRHYRETEESPTRRGQFRRYSNSQVEIFFPHNVYPFGVLGIRPSQDDPEHRRELVGLSSGGLSGRVGNTLEGIAQIMFDFFGCTDALVLDEGYDVFALINPLDGNRYRYNNQELLRRVLSFTKHRVDQDAADALQKTKNYRLGNDMKAWPLNKKYMEELEQDYKRAGRVDYHDVITVSPNRSQMRSVLIFAVREPERSTKRPNKRVETNRRKRRSPSARSA